MKREESRDPPLVSIGTNCTPACLRLFTTRYMPDLREWLVAARLGDYAPVVREYAGDLEDVAELTASDVEDITEQIQGKIKKRKFADAFAVVVAHAKRDAPISALVLEVTYSPSLPVRARLFARSLARAL